MDCRVVVEAAVPVYGVETADDAVRIAIAKTGNRLNPALNYVEITIGERACPACDDAGDAVFLVADQGLVALDLEIDVFTVADETHAERIALSEIGQRLTDIPLTVRTVMVLPEDDD